MGRSESAIPEKVLICPHPRSRPRQVSWREVCGFIVSVRFGGQHLGLCVQMPSPNDASESAKGHLNSRLRLIYQQGYPDMLVDARYQHKILVWTYQSTGLGAVEPKAATSPLDTTGIMCVRGATVPMRG